VASLEKILRVAYCGRINTKDMSDDPYKKIGHASDKRRSQRVLLQIPILVRAQFEGDTPLSEETHTLVVNAGGALINLAMKVKPGQKLILRNWSTAKEQACRVVHVREKPFGKNEVGIAFPSDMPQFWGLSFPPPDWTPQTE
jgi:PilZ domain